ncbi:hypothetical protein MVG78_15515 [Roseomonas gilardii subsp. gilardii]|uniref:hypothetical protein n=1 Tax=Roseomonas gilardii TaxID=257708 RepID=UPI001FFB802D|nr:hypothetical protein [Roseomonas gilardii]UPG71929.1 hypothetical protein MVG78_15515 [Roseomonas gilardii subsp. gilardii]
MIRPAVPVAFWVAPLAAPLVALLVMAGPARAQGTDFTLLNRTGEAIRSVYATPAQVPNWGPERLRGGPLSDGGSRRIRLDGAGGCMLDLRAVTVAGLVLDQRGVDVCQQRQVVFAPVPRGAGPGYGPGYGTGDGMVPGAAAFSLVNRSGRAVTQLYATPSTAGNWGPELLGPRGAIPPGAARSVAREPGACVYDLRVVYADGGVEDRKGLDTCAMPRITLP